MFANDQRISTRSPGGNNPFSIDNATFLRLYSKISECTCYRPVDPIVGFLFQQVDQQQNLGTQNYLRPARCSFNPRFWRKLVPCVVNERVEALVTEQHQPSENR